MNNVPLSLGQTQKCYKYQMWPEKDILFRLKVFRLGSGSWPIS